MYHGEMTPTAMCVQYSLVISSKVSSATVDLFQPTNDMQFPLL